MALEVDEIESAAHKNTAVGDDPIAFELLGDAADPLAFRDDHHRRGGERARPVELHPDEIEQADEQETRDEQQRQQAIDQG